MDSFSLPKKSEEEIILRREKIEAATKEATQIPLTVLQQSEKAAKLALEVAETGNVNSLSDAGVAGLAALTAAEGALYNVMINLGGIEDEDYIADVTAEARACNGRIQKLVARIKAHLHKELKIGK